MHTHLLRLFWSPGLSARSGLTEATGESACLVLSQCGYPRCVLTSPPLISPPAVSQQCPALTTCQTILPGAKQPEGNLSGTVKAASTGAEGSGTTLPPRPRASGRKPHREALQTQDRLPCHTGAGLVAKLLPAGAAPAPSHSLPSLWIVYRMRPALLM